MPDDTVKIVIEGADAFLGRAIVKELAKRGAGARGVVLSDGARLPSGIDKAVAALGDAAALAAAVEGATTVVMARKLLEERPLEGMTFDAVHAKRTGELLQACGKAGVKRFIYIGMGGVEHGGPAAMVASEIEAEKLISEADIERLVLRTSLVCGPGDGHIARLARKAKRPSPVVLFVGQGWARSAPMPARDFGRCVTELALAEDMRTGELGLGGGERLTAMEVFQRLQIHFGRTKVSIHVMLSIANVVTSLVEKFSKKPSVTKARLSWLIHNRVPESNVARELLGRFPRKFERAYGPGVADVKADAPQEPATEAS